MISLFNVAPVHSAQVLAGTPKLKAATCRAEKAHELDKLHSGKSYSAVGCEFGVNESKTYIK